MGSSIARKTGPTQESWMSRFTILFRRMPSRTLVTQLSRYSEFDEAYIWTSSCRFKLYYIQITFSKHFPGISFPGRTRSSARSSLSNRDRIQIVFRDFAIPLLEAHMAAKYDI